MRPVLDGPAAVFPEPSFRRSSSTRSASSPVGCRVTRVVFVTPNQGRQDDLRRLLPDLEVELRRLDLPVDDGLPLEEAATRRALAAYTRVGERCMVESTAFELEGAPPRAGAEVKRELKRVGEAAFCTANAGRAATTRVAVALVEHGQVTLFSGALEGTIPPAPRGEGGHGWDRVFVPEGHRRTLAELGSSTYLVNMRHGPYLDLADRLRGRAFGGAFEAHVTVRCGADELPRFEATCDALGVKHLRIELAAGVVTAQPMTGSVHRGTLREVQAEVHDLARALVAAGFEVVRTKIEALQHNADLPVTDAAAAAEPARYFEYHLKVVVPPDTPLVALRDAAASAGGRLSRNALRRRADGAEERYVTLRVPGLGRASADARFAALEAAVAALPVKIVRRVREYTVYDSNLALDRGWELGA